MNDTLKVGIVGFGGSGAMQQNLFPVIAGCRATAVFDPREPGRRRAAEYASECLITDDWHQFVESGIDAVAVCSPDRSHADYIERSLASRKHVICEKPLTDSVAGYRRILAATSASKDRVVAVQHQMRFIPLFRKMKEMIASGALGKVSYIEGYYVHDLRKRASVNDTWRFEDAATPLVYSGCHFVDLLRWLMADEVVEVMGLANHLNFPEYPESDCNAILLRFRNGAIGKVVTIFGSTGPQDHTVRVFGSEGTINGNLLFTRDGNWHVISRPYLDWTFSGITHPRGRLYYLCSNLRSVIAGRFCELGMKMAGKPGGYYGTANYPMRTYEHAVGVIDSLSDFVKAIRGGTQPLCNPAESARTVAVCLAGVEAYRTGKPVRVQDFWSSELGPL